MKELKNFIALVFVIGILLEIPMLIIALITGKDTSEDIILVAIIPIVATISIPILEHYIHIEDDEM